MLGHRVGRATQKAQRHGKVEAKFDIAGVQCHRWRKAAQRRLMITKPGVDVADRIEGQRVCGPQRFGGARGGLRVAIAAQQDEQPRLLRAIFGGG